MKKLSILFLTCLLWASCSEKPQVKNVIYLIGDGMGLGSVSSVVLTSEGQTGFEMAPVIGLAETSSADNHVSDSPAGGTALACGELTINGHIGLDPDGKPLESILKKAQKFGRKTGIVVNTVLTEATPAAFYGHVPHRSHSHELARQFVEESGVDVAIGSGLSVFINRPDSVDLTESLINKGYDVYLDWQSVLETDSDRFVGILPMDYVHRRNEKAKTAGAADGAEVCFAAKLAASEGSVVNDSLGLREPELYLEKAVAKAVATLDKSDEGFFLVVESAIIDGYAHNNDSEGLIVEMTEFDRTLKYLVDYVSRTPETLLVVVGDHETGGVSVGYNSHGVAQTEPLKLTFSTKGHSGVLVPVFAYGEGAEEFGKVLKNYEIPHIIETLMKH